MSYAGLRSLLPGFLRRQVLFFETLIVESVSEFAAQLPAGARLLDAGAGEGQYKHAFPRQRYTGIDMGIGDAQWSYGDLDVVGDLLHLPFDDAIFDACLSVVTLEHVTDPQRAVDEMARVAKPGALLLLVVPQDWEVHQHPHDYWRYTRFAVRRLLERSGWEIVRLDAGGGYFRLLSRRIMNGLQFSPAWLMPFLAIVVVPLGLLIGLLDSLDRKQDFTLGYICWARRMEK